MKEPEKEKRWIKANHVKKPTCFFHTQQAPISTNFSEHCGGLHIPLNKMSKWLFTELEQKRVFFGSLKMHIPKNVNTACVHPCGHCYTTQQQKAVSHGVPSKMASRVPMLDIPHYRKRTNAIVTKYVSH